MCSWLLAHRRQTAKKKDHPNLLPVLEVALEQRISLRCIGFGWLRSPISINQESEDNIELLPLYHKPCVTLCTLSLSCQTTLTKRQKKKKRKKESKIVRCQCTTKLTQVSSFSESHPSHGRARHQIRDWSESGRSRELLTPGTMTHAGRAASSPEIFRPFWPSVWPSSRSNFDLGPSPLDSTEKKSFMSELMILECSFPLRAYSFCAVFLFRFINRNGNRRVQKERLSFESNNFHGNQNGALFDFKLKRKKSTKALYENEIRKKNTGDFLDRLSRQTPCLRQPRYLLRSFSSVFERVFMVTSKKWRAAAVLTAVPFRREKRWKRCGTRRGIVCCAFRRSWGGTSTKASARKCHFQAAHEDKERNENVDVPA